MNAPKDWTELAPVLKARVPRGEQKILASKLGMSEAVLSRYLSGERVPDPVFLIRLSGALGVPVSQLLGEAPPEAPPQPGPRPIGWRDEEMRAQGLVRQTLSALPEPVRPSPPPGDYLNLDGDVDQAIDELARQTDTDRDAVLKQLIIDGLRAKGHDVGPSWQGRPVRIVEWPVENVPILGLAAAGPNRFPEWAHEDEEGADLPVLIAERARIRGWKLLRIRGDSMSPTYEDGDLVFVQPQKDIERLIDTDVVVFWNGEPQVKRFRVDDRNRWTLVPDNPLYPPIVPPAFEKLNEYGWFLAGVVAELAKRKG